MQAEWAAGALEDRILFALEACLCGASVKPERWPHLETLSGWAGGPPVVSSLEGAPSFRVPCERVGLSIVQVAAEKPSRQRPWNPTLAKSARMGHPAGENNRSLDFARDDRR